MRLFSLLAPLDTLRRHCLSPDGSPLKISRKSSRIRRSSEELDRTRTFHSHPCFTHTHLFSRQHSLLHRLGETCHSQSATRSARRCPPRSRGAAPRPPSLARPLDDRSPSATRVRRGPLAGVVAAALRLPPRAPRRPDVAPVPPTPDARRSAPPRAWSPAALRAPPLSPPLPRCVRASARRRASTWESLM